MPFQSDDAVAFLADFGVPVVNGTSETTGILSVRDVLEGGIAVRRQVLRLATGTGGTITEDTSLRVDGTVYRVDRAMLADDGLFTDYVLAG